MLRYLLLGGILCLVPACGKNADITSTAAVKNVAKGNVKTAEAKEDQIKNYIKTLHRHAKKALKKIKDRRVGAELNTARARNQLVAAEEVLKQAEKALKSG